MPLITAAETAAGVRPLQRTIRTRASIWQRVEREWFDVTSPPLLQRMAEAGWSPDHADAFCSNCARTVGPYEAASGTCAACRDEPAPPWDRVIRLGEYRALLRDLVHDVKFTRWHTLGRDLGRLLADALRQPLAAAGSPPVVLIPAPTTLRRRFSRGIDHSRCLAIGASKALGVPCIPALAREHRPSQLSVPPSQRVSNVANAFSPRRRACRAFSGKGVIVIDDVMTTGATMRGLCRAVREGGRILEKSGQGSRPVFVWAAVLARTEEGHHLVPDTVNTW